MEMPWCTLCESVVHFLENMVLTNDTVSKLEQNVEKVCSIFPDTMVNGCIDVVHKIIDGMVSLGGSSKLLCSLLTLCSPLNSMTGNDP